MDMGDTPPAAGDNATPLMNVACAATVLLGEEAFRHLGHVRILPDRSISNRDLREADALVVRSKTRVDAALLEGTSVRFVGTATAGTDHLDVDWLSANGIAHAAAPGCNASSVAEYVVASLFVLARRRKTTLAGKTIGIVGDGQVGSRLARKCATLGMRVLKNDPPLAADAPDDYVSLDALLAESDVVSLHVPLVSDGPWPTVRLADYRFFERLKPGAWFVNAARGEVCDADALLHARRADLLSGVVLDVWNPEPAFRPELLEIADLATPHVAGHSYEGKLAGTATCRRRLCEYFELPQRPLPPPVDLPAPEVELDAAGQDDEALLAAAIRSVYDPERDDRNLRAMAPLDEIERARAFDALRGNYPVRREFSAARLRLRNASADLKRKFAGIGFSIPSTPKGKTP